MKERGIPKYLLKKRCFFHASIVIKNDGFRSQREKTHPWEEAAHVVKLVNASPHTTSASKAGDLFKGSPTHCILRYSTRIFDKMMMSKQFG